MKNKVLYAAISAALMSPLSAYAVDILIPNDEKQSTYAVNLVSHVGKTWTYSVSQVQGRTLSHWVLGINNCLSNVVSSSPTADQIGTDPSTDAKFVGIKWNTAGGTFSFTLDKEYAETTLQAFVKTATVYNTGNITGPDCSKPVTSAADAAAAQAAADKAAADKAAADAAAKAAADKAAADAAAKAAADKAAAAADKAQADKEKADKEAVGKTSHTLCASSANMDSYAFSNSQGHSAWVPGIATDLVFADDALGQFVENADGTAKLTGNLFRRGDAKQGMIVDVTFTGVQTTAPEAPKKELNAKAYNEGKADMSKWYFYTGFEGTLTGTGNFEGGKIHIVRMGPAFQIGNGANGKNINFGASGWFSYDIVSQPTNPKYVFYKTSEHADFNVDLSPCSEKGTATSPASSVDSEGKSKHSNASFGLRVTTPRASGNNIEVEQDDDISVDASIIADSEHVGKTVDIIIVGTYGNKTFVRDGDDWKEWDGKLEHLTAAKKDVALSSSPVPANILKGKMKGMSGSCEVRVGYRVDGKLVYNDEALKFTVKK